ncbi:hypothetical protein DS831_05905 [Bombilactobacillus bombi]|uniref:Uncharacterized protein n=1 Tax=Bombilactobacillus bombi TaxID=1303590 RepID=A0A3R7CMY7_9LACO|nr:hypothetical protein [Bombilactobacillus bombi]RHW49695.1 hypothetical protein DS831_05905 [Bombilactobacillus bombi]
MWILYLILFAIFIISLALVILWFKNLIGQDTLFISNKIAKISAVVSICSLLLLVISFSFSNKENSNNTTSSEKIEQQQKDDENKVAEKKEKQKEENNTINSDISNLLEDDKKDASNGDSKYQYANYIQKLEYTKDNTKVYVNDNFINLDENTKNQVSDRLQGVIGSGVAMSDENYKPANDQQGYYLNFWYGKRAVGHSKLSDYHQYKWYSME